MKCDRRDARARGAWILKSLQFRVTSMSIEELSCRSFTHPFEICVVLVFAGLGFCAQIALISGRNSFAFVPFCGVFVSLPTSHLWRRRVTRWNKNNFFFFVKINFKRLGRTNYLWTNKTNRKQKKNHSNHQSVQKDIKAREIEWEKKPNETQVK